ncbi:MAG: hypothetical protein NC822_06605 [Candidatus Omnitrophica bacterium]|nr:hypothetical protein [Candidatus Omnitrophota bacterium]MCM8825975.1 hypothetical protein [Candidatus Omnitrophota bacterium]
MDKEKIKRCKRCALPETYPGVKFSEEGICNYCFYYDIYKERESSIKIQLKKEFLNLINSLKKKKKKYDCVVAYSGGKDSTFLLYFLKNKFKLNILAHTLDNCFLSPQAVNNIKVIVKRLNIAHISTKIPTELLVKILKSDLSSPLPYPKELLSMMSSVCVVCQGMVFGTTLKQAQKYKVPLMFIGYTPGQYPIISLENYFKVKSCVYFSSQVYKDDPLDIIKIARDPLDERFGKEIEPYYFKSQYIEKDEFVPSVLFPFHALVDYDEKIIYEKIYDLGWKKPQDTDPCSTNCLLNMIGNYFTMKRFGYHPYIGELSFLVREGKLSYQNALQYEYMDEAGFASHPIVKQLGLSKYL